MANWESLTIRDIVTKIKDDQIVLPVIQRPFVWDTDKMSLLFDSFLKGNAVGAIICIEEENNTEPLFAFRKFTRDGTQTQSVEVETLPQGQWFIIDGQQRLQSIYIGLTGAYNGKRMFFDLFSDYQNQEYDFDFFDFANTAKMPPEDNKGRAGLNETLWYPADELYRRLADTNDDRQVAGEIITRKSINAEDKKKTVEDNVHVFYRSIFGGNSIGISKVSVNKSKDKIYNRQRIVELFRRLNAGGTILSAYDLVATTLKGFDSRMESFLRSMTEQHDSIGLNQDKLLKTLLILRDTPNKEMADLTAEDADFIVKNRDRIEKTFEVVRQFLELAKLTAWYADKNRSFIPIYFVAYHIFHSDSPTDKLLKLFARYDTCDISFANMRRWILLSLLNGVFSDTRGTGWIARRTGIRKIHAVMQQSKKKDFPVDDLFATYITHPLRFSPVITKDNLTAFDEHYLFYLLYDCQKTFRTEDKDHVHPKSRLSVAGIEETDINNVANYQLLESDTNRKDKRAKELADWIINCVKDENREGYLKRHCIPVDEELWKTENFACFLEKRKRLIAEKINDMFS